MTPAPLANEQLGKPVVPVNQPVEAELPPPLPQLQAGELPAVLVPPITQEMMADPVIDAVVTNFPRLGELGLDYYEAQDMSTVLYNPELVSLEQLKEADTNGTLPQIAQPLGAVSGQPPAATAPAAQNAPLATEQLPAAPAEAGLQKARVQNMAPRQVSPIQPKPVTGQLAKRPI